MLAGIVLATVAGVAITWLVTSGRGDGDAALAARADTLNAHGTTRAPALPAPLALPTDVSAAGSPDASIGASWDASVHPLVGDAGTDAGVANHATAVETAQAAPARITVRVYPQGNVTIDGRAAGAAPVTRELASGTHTIAASNGANTVTRRVTLSVGERKTVLLELE